MRVLFAFLILSCRSIYFLTAEKIKDGMNEREKEKEKTTQKNQSIQNKQHRSIWLSRRALSFCLAITRSAGFSSIMKREISIQPTL